MIKKVLSAYSPGFATAIIYMLQATEYQAKPYFSWLRRVSNFRRVMYRRQLDKTTPAKLLLATMVFGMVLQISLGLLHILIGFQKNRSILIVAGTALIVLAPWLWAILITLPLTLGRWLIVRPQEKKLIKQSAAIFAAHPGLTIGIAGSYGKTSMKELLATVLQEGKRVAYTPANKNVAISHAYFARKLTGDEDVLIIEYGEGQPGDVARFARTTQPDIGIITGLAPAHLDHYKNADEAAADILSLADYLADRPVYVNADSAKIKHSLKPNYIAYGVNGIGNWKISQVAVGFDGTRFVLEDKKTRLELQSQLVGEHHVGPLACAAVIAHSLGLSDEQIIAGIAATQPYEHRMQPRYSQGVWIIDDTYNGTIEGMKAGLRLLKQLPATRKLYVTPGLVDQGVEAERVHHELGEAIAAAAPDVVVLMRNSTTAAIQEGLSDGKFGGSTIIEDDPLAFYTGIEQFTAAGDVVLMQNDWTDNYA